MATPQAGWVRKQFLFSASQIKKINQLAKSTGESAAEIVRQAIDAYDPNAAANEDETNLLEIALDRVNGAIKITQAACERIKQTRVELSNKAIDCR